tara:strand:+ start:349 stop:1362 length:1014 start_codon:yes stop_codon:yes gene_type:complete
MTLSNSPLELSHFPVMLNEVIEICSPNKGGFFVDCTFGGGGYSKKILKFSNTKVVAFDRDKYTLNTAKDLQKKYPKRFSFYQKKFSEIDTVIGDQLVDIILFDLGLSTIQLNNLDRGFSFKSKKKLDMSMGLTSISAEEVINNLNPKKLKSIIQILGEEKDASKIVKNIIRSRSIKKISKVNELVEIITKSKKKDYKNKINPCTKTFQALRIFVNKEISELTKGIINATKVLKPGGKILIISFHSIEDKIVKFFFNNFSSNRSRPSRYIPEKNNDNSLLFNRYKNKAMIPTAKEIAKNFPSRSAKLRYAIRNGNKFTYPKELIVKFKKYIDLENSHA